MLFVLLTRLVCLFYCVNICFVFVYSCGLFVIWIVVLWLGWCVLDAVLIL